MLIRKVQVVAYLTKNRNGSIPFHFGRFGFGLSSLIPMNRLTHGPGCEKAPTIWTNHNAKRSTVKVLLGSVLLCPRPVPGLLGWAYPEQLGLSSTACGLVLGHSIRPCTNGVSLLYRIASVSPLSKPQTMY